MEERNTRDREKQAREPARKERRPRGNADAPDGSKRQRRLLLWQRWGLPLLLGAAAAGLGVYSAILCQQKNAYQTALENRYQSALYQLYTDLGDLELSLNGINHLIKGVEEVRDGE